MPLAHEVIEAVDAAGFHMNVYVDDKLFVEELNEEAVTYATHARLEAHAVGDLLAWLDRPTTKIVVVGEPEALDRLQDELRAQFDSRAFIAKSLPIFLELALPGKGKLHLTCTITPLDQGDALPCLGEVERGRRTDRAASDDDHVRRLQCHGSSALSSFVAQIEPRVQRVAQPIAERLGQALLTVPRYIVQLPVEARIVWGRPATRR